LKATGSPASTLARAAAAVALAAAALTLSAQAEAFCRSTTCSGDCPLDADGCKSSGIPLWWSSMCVGMSIQQDASRHIDLEVARPPIVAAFTEWSRRACEDGPASIAFTELPDAACHQVEYVDGGPNANLVMFQDDKWTYGGAQNTLAMTTVTFDADTGELLDADMEINHALNELTVSNEHVVYDLQSIVTHEVGHLLGLDHSTAAQTIMRADYAPSSTEHRTLDADDIEAVCAAYPADRQARCDAMPEGGFTSACVGERSDEGCSMPRGRSPGDRSAWGAVLAVALLLWSRRARRPS
jgi:hypothetical protein